MNMWIPQREAIGEDQIIDTAANDDRCDQLTESLCRFIFGSVVDAVHRSNQSIPLNETEGWYSPSEKDKDIPGDDVCGIPEPLLDHDQNLSYLFASLAQLQKNETNQGDLLEFSPFVKKRIVQRLLSTVLHPSSLREMASKIMKEINGQVEEN